MLSLARRLLAENDGRIGLAGSAVDELVQSQGLGPAKASEVAAAFELARQQAARGDRPDHSRGGRRRGGPDTAALRHEEFACPWMQSPHRPTRTVSRGDIDGTEAGPRLFFRNALIAGAATTVAVHNHPTGDPSPSQGDLAVTRRLIECGRLIDCTLVDHIVIGDGQRHHSIRRSHPHLWGSGERCRNWLVHRRRRGAEVPEIENRLCRMAMRTGANVSSTVSSNPAAAPE